MFPLKALAVAALKFDRRLFCAEVETLFTFWPGQVRNFPDFGSVLIVDTGFIVQDSKACIQDGIGVFHRESLF